MPPEGATKWMVPDGTIQRRVDAVRVAPLLAPRTQR